MSPTEAMNVAAVCTLTPGTLISRSTSGQASACLAISRRARRPRRRGSRPGAGTVERQPLVDRQLELAPASGGRLAERVGDRRPLAEVARQARHAPRSSRASGRARAARAGWSAAAASASAHPASTPHRAGPSISSLRQRPRVEPIGLRLRLGDRLQLARVGDHHPDPCACSTETILSAPSSPPAPPRLWRQALREQLQRRHPRRDPTGRPDLPSSAIATSQKSRCTSNPRPRTPLLSSTERERGGTHDSDGFVLSAHPGKSQGRPRTTSSSQLISQNGLPIRVSQQAPCPGSTMLTAGPDAVSSPDNGSAYRSTLHALACRALGIRHLRTRPYRPAAPTARPNASSAPCSRGWAYGAIYRQAQRTRRSP